MNIKTCPDIPIRLMSFLSTYIRSVGICSGWERLEHGIPKHTVAASCFEEQTSASSLSLLQVVMQPVLFQRNSEVACKLSVARSHRGFAAEVKMQTSMVLFSPGWSCPTTTASATASRTGLHRHGAQTLQVQRMTRH